VTRDGGATFQTVGDLPLQRFPWVLGLVFDRAHRNPLSSVVAPESLPLTGSRQEPLWAWPL